MSDNRSATAKNMFHVSPLVVGYPRTGFTLLISVIVEILNHAQIIKVGNKTLKAFCDSAGMQIAANIEKVFERHRISNDLLYNYNFRHMVGGPKWLGGETERLACFRRSNSGSNALYKHFCVPCNVLAPHMI